MAKHDYVIGIDQSYTRTGIMVLENKSIVENHEELFKSKTGYEEAEMDYFKKCPKCGRYMSPYIQYKFGYSYTLWICPCGYSEDIGDTRVDNKTIYMGGGASDGTVD